MELAKGAARIQVVFDRGSTIELNLCQKLPIKGSHLHSWVIGLKQNLFLNKHTKQLFQKLENTIYNTDCCLIISLSVIVIDRPRGGSQSRRPNAQVWLSIQKCALLFHQYHLLSHYKSFNAFYVESVEINTTGKVSSIPG